MKHALIPTFALLLTLPLSAGPASKPTPADRQTFELTPTAPPTPALKYQLLFDDFADRHPGDAVPLYCDAMLLLPEEFDDKLNKAEDALLAGDPNTFYTLAAAVNQHPALYDELDLAARREHCDWQPPFREKGLATLLPHLNACRQLARAIYARARVQTHEGNPVEALRTLRLGYEMADKFSREPVLVAGLVSVGITAYFDDALADLMSHPKSPNLYWALREFPGCKPNLRLDTQRLGSLTYTFPPLAKAIDGETLPPDQWRSILAAINKLSVDDKTLTKPLDPFTAASYNTLTAARAQYAIDNHFTQDQADLLDLDNVTLLGPYYLHQYLDAYDGFYKLRNLPYSASRPLASAHQTAVEKLIADNPANPFLHRLLRADRAIETYARTDRQLAALAAVEAVRSYAATHDGSLPPTLAAVTETPAPNNPATDEPFDYKLDHDTATLSAPDDRYPLIYTIKIRK